MTYKVSLEAFFITHNTVSSIFDNLYNTSSIWALKTFIAILNKDEYISLTF